MQALFQKFLFSKNCNFYPVTFYAKRHQKFPLLLPSHNCIIIHNVQFSRYIVEANSAHSVSVFSYRFCRKLHIALLLLLSNQNPLRWAFDLFYEGISFKKLNEASSCEGTSVNFLWWRVPGSNRWPPACKAGALPAELTPHLGILYCLGTFYSVPSKLNNVKLLTLCTDLRTLQDKSSFILKSP